MVANIYGQYGVDVKEIFRRIDRFLAENFDKLEDKNQILNNGSLDQIKILICDLTALEGLSPSEIKHSELLIFELQSIMNMYYIKNEKISDPTCNFFLLP